MFGILGKSLSVGVVTTKYPATPPEISARARGRPEIDWANWKDARPAAAICPTGAIAYQDDHGRRAAQLDLAKCVFCGLCAEVDPAIRMTNICECAARSRQALITGATYTIQPDGTHAQMISSPLQLPAAADWRPLPSGTPGPMISPPQRSSASTSSPNEPLESLGQKIQARAHEIFGRSLHIRQVDAGSCNGCEMEIVNLSGPIYDLERFGIHFVASPRHADLLLVTGPVTRNMELALKKTLDAMPEPRLVVAVGTCGCSGGIFGQNYASLGGVDKVIPVDVYVPGCPPNPHALLHGILLALGRCRRES